MMYSLVILKAICDVCENNGGAVRPIDVERELENAPLNISRYKIRQMFKELKEDGLLGFDGNMYIWRETHWLNNIGSDILSVMGK